MAETSDTGEGFDPNYREPQTPPKIPGVNEPWDAGDAPPPPPPPSGPRREETPDAIRSWTLLAHGSALIAAFFALAFMGPLVVWLIRKDIDPISGAHAKEALNFNISIIIYGIGAFLTVFVLVGFVLLPLVGLFWIINVIRAMIAVNAGQTFQYPATIRFIR